MALCWVARALITVNIVVPVAECFGGKKSGTLLVSNLYVICYANYSIYLFLFCGNIHDRIIGCVCVCSYQRRQL